MIVRHSRNPASCGRLAVALGALLALDDAALAQTAGDAGAKGDQLQEIVVTASKRAEKLSNVPSSVDAFTAEKIDNLGIVQLDDYIGLVPNLAQVSQGAPGNSTIIIRGIYTGVASTTATTAYYLDEAALTSSATYALTTYISPDADLADVDHIEVLKGPQATLYGANALGGVLRVITKKPDPTAFSGNIRADLTAIDGGEIGYALRTSVNVPLVQDRAALRVNVFHRYDPGYYDNAGTGQTNVNDDDVTGVRAALRVIATDDLTIDVNGLYQSIDANSLGLEYDEPGTATPAFGRYTFSAGQNQPSRTRYSTLGGTIAYKTDLGTLTGTAGYAKYSTYISTDSTNLFAPFILGFGLADPGYNLYTNTTAASTKTTAEVRFASNRLGPIEFIVGAFYTYEDDFFHTYYPIKNADGSAPAAFGGILLDSPNINTYEEEAGFGDLTYYITDDLDIQGGYRFSSNNQFIDSKTFGFYALFFPTALYTTSGYSRDYLATVRWRPDEDTNLYARVASGYRPGGPNIGAVSFGTFGSDEVWNYEIGAKGSLFDRKLLYSVAAYRVDWSNVQLPSTDPVSGSQITVNGGRARVNGAEAELTVRPLSKLSLTAAVGFNDTRLDSVEPAVSATTGAVAGDKLPLTPKWTASLTADYVADLNEHLTLTFGGTITYQGTRNSSFLGTTLDQNVVIPDYTTLDLRTSLTIDDRYHLTFRGENVTNEAGISSTSLTQLFPGQPGVYNQAVLIRPRTFILSAGVDF